MKLEVAFFCSSPMVMFILTPIRYPRDAIQAISRVILFHIWNIGGSSKTPPLFTADQNSASVEIISIRRLYLRPT